MHKKIYDVTVTSKCGRVWRYQVEATGRSSARITAVHVKRFNKYRGKTLVHPQSERK